MPLPQAPTVKEKYLYINQAKWIIYPFGLVSFACLISGMVLFSLAHSYTAAYLGFTCLVFLYLGLSYFIGIFGRGFDVYGHNQIRDAGLAFKPTIDVYLPSCGEPLEVLQNTYRYVRQLDWPEDKLRVYVLDDAGNPEVERMAGRFDFVYISRPKRGELKKAGNIRYAFPRTSGEFILILDADFCPRPDMLIEMMPYFDYDSKIAIVQSPQFFSVDSDMTWIEKGSAYIQELFYRMIQTNRDTWRASICVGTCAVYRRKALEPHGGTYPIEYSEDMHTGWQVTVDGSYVKYIPINLSKGICPDTMRAFFTQQLRWCTGATSLLFSRKFWVNPLSFMQRLCYLSGMFYYLATAVSIFLTPLPSIIMVWVWPEKVFWFNYLFSVPSFIFGVLVFPFWGRLRFGFYVLTTRQVAFYAHLFALVDKVQGSVQEWVPTGGAVNRTARYERFKSVLFYWTCATTSVAFAGAFYNMEDLVDLNFYPLLFFSTLNYFVSMMALKNEA